MVVYGGRDRVLAIRLDEEKINSLGLSSYLVAQRIDDLEFVSEAGLVRSDGMLRTVAIRERAHHGGSAARSRRCGVRRVEPAREHGSGLGDCRPLPADSSGN